MTENRTITDDEGLALLKQIVAEHPDYQYGTPDGAKESCVYVDQAGNKPSCLIGHWLHRLGVPLTDIIPFEGQQAAGVLGPVRQFFNVSDSLENVLNRVQDQQDGGVPWGEALAFALEVSDE